MIDTLEVDLDGLVGPPLAANLMPAVSAARGQLLSPARPYPELSTRSDFERAAWEALALIVAACRDPDPDPLVVIGAQIPMPSWAAGTGAFSTLATTLRACPTPRRPLGLLDGLTWI